jgi:hypothetical protein
VNDGGLKKKRERRVSQRKIAIWELPQRNADARIQNVARVPKNREMRVLPEHNDGTGHKEQGRGEQIARAPEASGQRRFELDQFGHAHSESQAEVARLPLNPLIFAARDWLRKPTQPLSSFGSRLSRKIFCFDLGCPGFLLPGSFGFF